MGGGQWRPSCFINKLVQLCKSRKLCAHSKKTPMQAEVPPVMSARACRALLRALRTKRSRVTFTGGHGQRHLGFITSLIFNYYRVVVHSETFYCCPFPIHPTFGYAMPSCLVGTHWFAQTALWMPSPAPQTEQSQTNPIPWRTSRSTELREITRNLWKPYASFLWVWNHSLGTPSLTLELWAGTQDVWGEPLAGEWLIK